MGRFTSEPYGGLLAVLAFAFTGCATASDLGQSALENGRWTDAARQFELALNQHPNRIAAFVGLGIARYEQGAYDVRQRCQSFAAGGHLELCKPTKRCDGGVGREKHGDPPAEQLPLRVRGRPGPRGHSMT